MINNRFAKMNIWICVEAEPKCNKEYWDDDVFKILNYNPILKLDDDSIVKIQYYLEKYSNIELYLNMKELVCIKQIFLEMLKHTRKLKERTQIKNEFREYSTNILYKFINNNLDVIKIFEDLTGLDYYNLTKIKSYVSKGYKKPKRQRFYLKK